MSQTPAPTAIEDRLQLLIEAVVDYGIFVLDPQGHVATWNSGAQKLNGWTPQEIIGRHFSVFYPQEAVASGWPQEELRRATHDGRFEDEGWRLRKDGSRFWANVVITALRDPGTGVLTGFAKVTRDLTERRAHEEALRVSEERFRLLVDSVHDQAIFMVDPGGVVRSWNRAAELILGYSGEDILGRHVGLILTASEREARHPRASLDAATAHGKTEEESWRVRQDGSRFWARSVTTALHGRTGEPLGFAVVLQDLSQQRRLEELEQSSRRMSEFIAMLAHELRNPLAPIRNAVSLMQLDKELPPKVARVRDIIDRQVTQLTRLVDDLLDVSRVTTGKITLRPECISLGEVVRRSIETVRPLIDTRRHDLRIELSPDDQLMVDGDLTRLSQVVQNLLVNAAKYTPEGGRLRIRAHPVEGDVEVDVQDNGRGIAPEDLDRIFELFAQAESSGTSIAGVDGGLGVGLALSRALLRMHGGRMAARSAGPGKGSTFSFRIPAAR